MSDLILVPCPTCDGNWKQCDDSNWILTEECSECEGSGWVLVEGEPVSMEDLERMAPWADEPVGRPLESGEVDGLH